MKKKEKQAIYIAAYYMVMMFIGSIVHQKLGAFAYNMYVLFITAALFLVIYPLLKRNKNK